MLTFAFVVLVFILLIVLWKRRWLYYHTLNFPGPFAIPLLGNVPVIMNLRRDFYPELKKITHISKTLRLWFGPFLFIFTRKPDDVQLLLRECLEKSFVYKNSEPCLRDGIVISPLKVWKGRRKIINKTFNVQILDSYTEVFGKFSKKLVEELDGLSGQGAVRMLPIVWRYSIYTICETILDVDASLVVGVEEYIANIKRFGEFALDRFLRPWLAPNFLLNLSQFGKDYNQVAGEMYDFIHQILILKKSQLESAHDEGKDKRFLNYLYSLMQRNELTEHAVSSEAQNMIIGSTETTTYCICFTLLALGFSPEIQDKAYEEIFSIFGNDSRDPNMDDVNKMEYLDRIIKESLRVLPPIPFIARYVDKTISSDAHVYPEGSNVVFPFMKMHMDPDQWPNPNRFDPDRFLPEEVEKRRKGLFLPFSFGPRGCPGSKFAMISLKITLSGILRRFVVESVNYRKIEDIELVYHLLAYPKDGCLVKLTKRGNFI